MITIRNGLTRQSILIDTNLFWGNDIDHNIRHWNYFQMRITKRAVFVPLRADGLAQRTDLASHGGSLQRRNRVFSALLQRQPTG